MGNWKLCWEIFWLENSFRLVSPGLTENNWNLPKLVKEMCIFTLLMLHCIIILVNYLEHYNLYNLICKCKLIFLYVYLDVEVKWHFVLKDSISMLFLFPDTAKKFSGDIVREYDTNCSELCWDLDCQISLLE